MKKMLLLGLTAAAACAMAITAYADGGSTPYPTDDYLVTSGTLTAADFYGTVTAPSCAGKGTTGIDQYITADAKIAAQAGRYTELDTKDGEVKYIIDVITYTNHVIADKTEEVAPTCTEDGVLREVEYCTVCGEEFKSSESYDADALGHAWVIDTDKDGNYSVAVPATCVTPAVYNWTCSRCGATQQAAVSKDDETYAKLYGIVDPTNHEGKNYDNIHVEKAATCLKDGVGYKFCTSCQQTVQVVIPATGHNLSIVQTQKLNCAQDQIVSITCTNEWCDCKNNKVTEVEGAAIDAATWKYAENLPAKVINDADDYIEYVDPTFNTSLQNHEYHLFSTKVFEETYVKYLIKTPDFTLDPNGTCYTADHVFSCMRVGCDHNNGADETMTTSVKVGHEFTEWKLVHAIGHDDNAGYYIRQCVNCGFTDYKVTFEDPDTEIIDQVDPTCTEAGYVEYRKFDKAGNKYTEKEVIPALGHNYVNGLCSRCSAVDPSYSGLVTIDGKAELLKDGKLVDVVGYETVGDNTYFFIHGVVDQTAMGAVQDPNNTADWYFVANGMVQNVTSLVEYDGQWFYAENGKIDTSDVAQMIPYDGELFAVACGRIIKEANGLMVGPSGATYLLAEGRVVDEYTGLSQYMGSWFYVKDGVVDFTFSGTVEYDGAEFEVVNGEVVK